jgi:hypothetical protein
MTPNAFMRLSLPLFSLVSAVAASGQTAQRPARVEVAVPQPPVPVLADGKRVLVYELSLRTSGGERSASAKSTSSMAPRSPLPTPTDTTGTRTPFVSVTGVSPNITQPETGASY